MARPDPALFHADRYPFAFEISTRFADLDPNDHVNNVAMAALLEDGRVRYMNAIGIRRVWPEVRFMVASVTIDYVAQAHYPGTIACHSGAVSLGRTSYTLQQLLTQDGTPVATAQTVVVCTDGHNPIPITAEVRGAFDKWMLA
jgi:acyl-CoA thioester hydrolase